LVVDPKSGALVTSPSISPENDHGHGSSLVAGPAMDQAIVRDLFDNCLKAEAVLGADKAFVAELKAARDKLAPDKIGKDGQLQEWQEDWDADAPTAAPPRLASLRPVPVGPDRDRHHAEAGGGGQDLAAEARRHATGWAIAWRLNLWARLGEGDHAHSVLKPAAGSRADLSEHVRRPPAVPDRRQFRRDIGHDRDGPAKPKRPPLSAAGPAVSLADRAHDRPAGAGRRRRRCPLGGRQALRGGADRRGRRPPHGGPCRLDLGV
jgi:hypothetical protein